MRRAAPPALRSASDSRFGEDAVPDAEEYAPSLTSDFSGGGTCSGVTTPAGSPARSMRAAPGLRLFTVGGSVDVGYERLAQRALGYDTGERGVHVFMDANLERLGWLRGACKAFWKLLAQELKRAFERAHADQFLAAKRSGQGWQPFDKPPIISPVIVLRIEASRPNSHPVSHDMNRFNARTPTGASARGVLCAGEGYRMSHAARMSF